MKKYIIKRPIDNLSGNIFIPFSKSISNRVLIIKALSKKNFNINNLSNSEDTKILENFLKKENNIININNSGTVARFLISYLSIQENKEFLLKGSKRMSERPVKELVEVMRNIGANIEYLEKNNFLPLKIIGKKLKGGNITIAGNISSQYISSLILIAPILENGLKININLEIISKSYIDMSLKIIEYFGINYIFKDNIIDIPQQEYIGKDFSIEGDWSSASYFFSIALFSENPYLKLNNLDLNSLQGDSIISKISNEFGITSKYRNNILEISKDNSFINNENFVFDFTNCPDIAQTVAIMCLYNKKHSILRGLKSLKIKETDRIKALFTELSKLDIKVIYNDEQIEIFSNEIDKNKIIEFDTYNDHRMAMSLIPLCFLLEKIIIKDPDIVIKSYPDFWEDLKKIGFIIEEVK